MSDKVTNEELLRSINRLESKMEKIDSKVKNFKYWAFAIVISVFTALAINKFLF